MPKPDLIDRAALQLTMAELKPCPVCGAKPFVSKDVVDGFWFGWSAGCPRYCNRDGIHGHDENTPPEKRWTRFSFPSKEKAIEWWQWRADNAET